MSVERLRRPPPGAGDPLGKAQVVAKARARSALASDPSLVDHKGAQALGGAIDGGREPGRPGAHDDDVVRLFLEIDRRAAAAASSAFEGSLSARPSGRTMSGSLASGPALASSSRPSSDFEAALVDLNRGGAELEVHSQLVQVPLRPRPAASWQTGGSTTDRSQGERAWRRRRAASRASASPAMPPAKATGRTLIM